MKYLKLNETQNTASQNVWDIANTVLRRKYSTKLQLVLLVPSQKILKALSDFNFHLNKLENEQ